MNKLAWVVPSLETGLGKYTDNVREILKKFFHLDIFAGEIGFEIDELASYGNIIYNFGNSKDSIPLYLAIRKYPGIAILHDRTYHHLFAYYYFEYLNKPQLYYEVLDRIYCEKVCKYAERKKNEGVIIWETEDCLKYPMRELIYPYATAIIVHSESFLNMIKKEYDGEASYLQLPFSGISISDNFQNLTDRNNGRIKLISYGFISENRMIEEVLKVIGEIDELKQRIQYLIAGSIHDVYLEKIQKWIEDYDLAETVKLLGFLPEKELYKYISASDVCVNLRRYNTEGASWSLLEQMFFGKAVLVFDSGFFSEFPDSVLIKIRKIEDLRDKLLEIINNPSMTHSVGKIAKSYVVANFNAERYSYDFIKFLDRTTIDREKRKLLYNLMRNLVNSISLKSKNTERKFFNDLSNNILEIFYR